MQVAGLKEGSYTYEVWEKMGSPGEYIPQDSNEETIAFIRDGGVGIVPIMNTYGGSVREEIDRIVRGDGIHIKGWYNLPIKHVLAGSGKLTDIQKVHAHKQALIQCSDGLKQMGVSTEYLINNYNSIIEIPNTIQCVIEINDCIGVLEKITTIFKNKMINLKHVHSFPNGEGKFRFYISYDNNGINLLQLNRELEKIGGKMILEQKKQIEDSEIKLMPRNTNADGIPEAQENTNIGVICSEETALSNGLQILNEELSPQDNMTSFAILANNSTRVNLNNFKGIVQDRVLGLLTLPNQVGILKQSLSIISNVGLSLSFILSLNDGDGGARIAVVMNKGVNGEIYNIRKKLNQINGNLKVI